MTDVSCYFVSVNVIDLFSSSRVLLVHRVLQGSLAPQVRLRASLRHLEPLGPPGRMERWVNRDCL